MSRNENGRPQPRTAKERHADFLKEHEERMRKVDETIDAVKNRSERSSRASKKRARA
jgi:hypothetical protein